MVKKVAVKKTNLPKFYFSFTVLWLRFTGIELLEKYESVLYKLYSTCTILFAAGYNLLQFIELKFHNDFNSLTVVGWYVIIHSITLAKVAMIYRNRKEIGDLMRSFHKGHYLPDRERGGEFEEQCVRETLKRSCFQTNRYGFIILVACIAGLVSSIKTRLTEPPENWILPYTSISLFDISRSPNFEILYVYQALEAYVNCGWIYLCDCTVISIIAQTVAQLRILEQSIRNYKSRSRQIQFDKGRSSVIDTLQTAIKHHLDILKTIDEIEDLCSYLVMWVFVADIALLCLVMYHVTLIRFGSPEFVKYIFYTAAVALQLFMYCWWGNEMTLANEALALGIFETYYPDDPIFQAKVLKLMLVKAQKPLFFTAGKFVPLSLDTFKGILKMSFSYFTVLRQVNSN